jgi:tryptophan 2,3-dioxygenase
MTMTRKDYVKIANVMSAYRGAINDDTHLWLCWELADALQDTNDHFDHHRFTSACEGPIPYQLKFEARR